MESARTQKRTHAGICLFHEHSPELQATWGIVANDIAVPVRPKSVIRLAGPSLGFARAWNSYIRGLCPGAPSAVRGLYRDHVRLFVAMAHDSDPADVSVTGVDVRPPGACGRARRATRVWRGLRSLRCCHTSLDSALGISVRVNPHWPLNPLKIRGRWRRLSRITITIENGS